MLLRTMLDRILSALDKTSGFLSSALVSSGSIDVVRKLQSAYVGLWILGNVCSLLLRHQVHRFLSLECTVRYASSDSKLIWIYRFLDTPEPSSQNLMMIVIFEYGSTLEQLSLTLFTLLAGVDRSSVDCRDSGKGPPSRMPKVSKMRVST